MVDFVLSCRLSVVFILARYCDLLMNVSNKREQSTNMKACASIVGGSTETLKILLGFKHRDEHY